MASTGPVAGVVDVVVLLLVVVVVVDVDAVLDVEVAARIVVAGESVEIGVRFVESTGVGLNAGPVVCGVAELDRSASVTALGASAPPDEQADTMANSARVAQFAVERGRSKITKRPYRSCPSRRRQQVVVAARDLLFAARLDLFQRLGVDARSRPQRHRHSEEYHAGP